MADYFYGPISAVCENVDGKVRRVRVRKHVFDGSIASDTYFSAPAFVRVRGKTLRGYVTGRDTDAKFRPDVKHEFRVYNATK